MSRAVPQGVVPRRPGPHCQGATCLDQPVKVIVLALAPRAHVKLKVASAAEAFCLTATEKHAGDLII